MSEQLVPATPVVELHSQQGSRYVCVGWDALSAADELVEGVAVDLQQVIAQMKQAAHVNFTPGAKFGTENKAVLHTYIQVAFSSPCCVLLSSPKRWTPALRWQLYRHTMVLSQVLHASSVCTGIMPWSTQKCSQGVHG